MQRSYIKWYVNSSEGGFGYEEKNSNYSNEIYENKKSINETKLVALIKENVIKAIKEGCKNGIFKKLV